MYLKEQPMRTKEKVIISVGTHHYNRCENWFHTEYVIIADRRLTKEEKERVKKFLKEEETRVLTLPFDKLPTMADTCYKIKSYFRGCLSLDVDVTTKEQTITLSNNYEWEWD